MARTVLTSKYRSDNVRLFIQDVLDNNYYLFVSGQEEKGVINTKDTDNDFFEKVLFGKKIKDEEIFFMIKNYPWSFQTVYTQYDDQTDLTNTNYYAVVYPENNRTGVYRIYKCLFNNYGALSTSPPNYTEGQPNQEYQTSDGYVWKFMYEISAIRFDKFNAVGYVPIEKVFNQDDGTIDSVGYGDGKSSIDQIFVENNEDNIGYEEISGKVVEVVRDEFNAISSVRLQSDGNIVTDSFDAISNYYSGYSFYVTSFNSQLYEIDVYTFNRDGTATITLKGNIVNEIIQENATFQIFPKVEILGDGVGAEAIPVINDEGTITKIKMINTGSGYTRAKARIPTPKFGFDTSETGLDVPAILRPILSPANGHGTNLIDELGCKHALIYTSFEEADNTIIPTSNQFANIAIIKNPLFKTDPEPDVFDNRIRLNLPGNSLAVDEIITQLEVDPTSPFFDDDSLDGYDKFRFSGRIHEATNDDVYICQYMGAYPNDVDDTPPSYGGQDFSDISLNVELPLYSSQSEILQINKDGTGVTISPYYQKTGDIYYHSSLFPLIRTEDSREQFKIILEF